MCLKQAPKYISVNIPINNNNDNRQRYFFQIVEKFEYIPFEQTLAWENYKDESGSHFNSFCG